MSGKFRHSVELRSDAMYFTVQDIEKFIINARRLGASSDARIEVIRTIPMGGIAGFRIELPRPAYVDEIPEHGREAGHEMERNDAKEAEG